MIPKLVMWSASCQCRWCPHRIRCAVPRASLEAIDVTTYNCTMLKLDLRRIEKPSSIITGFRIQTSERGSVARQTSHRHNTSNTHATPPFSALLSHPSRYLSTSKLTMADMSTTVATPASAALSAGAAAESESKMKAAADVMPPSPAKEDAKVEEEMTSKFLDEPLLKEVCAMRCVW